jgi:hypothetical protein
MRRPWVTAARAACEGALAIDPNVAEPHACLGSVLAGTASTKKLPRQYSTALQREPIRRRAVLWDRNRVREARSAERCGTGVSALRFSCGLNTGAPTTCSGVLLPRCEYDDALGDVHSRWSRLTPDSYRATAASARIYFMKDQIPDAMRSCSEIALYSSD